MAEIRAGRYWISGFATVTPITRNSCRIDLSMAWYLYYWWPFAASTLKLIFWIFFLQDRSAMTRQAEGVSALTRQIFIDDADRPARWYYQLKRAYLEAERDGRSFEHRLRDTVKLTWRSPDVGDIAG